MCILEYPRKTNVAAFCKTLGKQVFLQRNQENRRVVLGLIREVKTTKRGILQSPKMHFGNLRKTSISTKPDKAPEFKKIVGLP